MKINEEIGTIMTTDLVTVTDDTPVTQLQQKFKRRGIHHILVENNIGELLGIISTEDFIRSSHFPYTAEKLEARHIMTASPTKVRTTAKVKEVIDIFLESYFRAIPVVNADEVLVGVVTPYDIMSMLAGKLENSD